MVEGFKNTEVGVIPNDWEVKPIAEITSLMTNGFVGTVKSHYTDYENGILYIQGYNVEENSFNYNGIKRVTEEFHKKHAKSCLQEDDMLTIQTGDIGVTTVVPRQLAGSNCHALIITRFKKGKADPKFYSYYFNFSVGRRRLKEIETGSTMKHINVGDMIQMLIPYPTKAEQTTIATALNDADALISQLEQLLTKKRNIKTGAMQELLKPKEGWEVKKLGEIFDITAGGDFKKNMSSETQDERHPFPIYSNSLQNYGAYGFSSYYTCEANCITVTARGTIGYSCFRNQKFTAIGRLLVLKPKLKLDCFYFSEYINNKLEFVLEVTGVPQLTAPQISSYEVSFPMDKVEQTRIAQIFSDMDNEIQELEKKIEKYKMLKQGMMQSLLTGKIRLV